MSLHFRSAFALFAYLKSARSRSLHLGFLPAVTHTHPNSSFGLILLALLVQKRTTSKQNLYIKHCTSHVNTCLINNPSLKYNDTPNIQIYVQTANSRSTSRLHATIYLFKSSLPFPSIVRTHE